MADLQMKEINTTGDVRRKFLACAVDVSDGAGTPEYVVLGYKIGASTLEMAVDSEPMEDINGVQHTDINKIELSQQFSDSKLAPGDKGKLQNLLLHYVRTNQTEKLSQFKCIVIYAFYGTTGAYDADLYEGCTISPENIGGEGWTTMSFTVNFGGKVTHGAVDNYEGVVNFTPNTPSA